MREVRVGLIGWGTIGTGVVKLLQRNQRHICARLGARITLAAIADVDLRSKRDVRVDRRILTTDARRILADPRIDIVVELMGGYEPARRFGLEAIAQGKALVTANKALLAVHGEEIFRAAERAGTEVGFEASVGGGIPIVRALKEGLAGDRNQAVYGIVNGTCNYLLSTMRREATEFATVLRRAQRDGLAEPDPSFDIDGIDAAHKLTLLIQLALGVRVRFADVPIEGIRDIAAMDVAFAAELGYVVKLLAIAKADGAAVEARVHPTMIPQGHPLADVEGAFNAIVVSGEALGPSMYIGQGAGMMPTATAVVADIMQVARNRLRGAPPGGAPLGLPLARLRRARIRPLADLVGQYYLRFQVVDRPGVLAHIAGILGKQEISIASVIQKARERGSTVPVVIRTHEARERNLRRALAGIAKLPAVKARPRVIRIEDSLGA